jgi:serine/threonine protein kinase
MSPFADLPLDRLLKANEACNRFEAALRAGHPARLDDFLADICAQDQPTVRAELEAIAQACSDERMPTSIGEYDVLELLGKGGMGRVYRARHRTMKRDVALKVL